MTEYIPIKKREGCAFCDYGEKYKSLKENTTNTLRIILNSIEGSNDWESIKITQLEKLIEYINIGDMESLYIASNPELAWKEYMRASYE